MKTAIQFLLTAAALAGLTALMLAPQAGSVLPNNPLAALGVALIGLGLIRNAQQVAAPAPVRA